MAQKKGGVEGLRAAMEGAAGALRGWPAETVQVVHHNDSDGLSSGAILTRAFERAGYGVRRCCLEKPYPKVLERIFAGDGRIIVFADFAGRIAPLIGDLNRGRNLVLILDHHVAEPATEPLVHNLDGDLFGLEGDRDISASTTCYLFATTLDAANRDLAHIAAIGAVGDGFFVDGRLVGENREAALEAAQQGSLEIVEGGEKTFRPLSLKRPVEGVLAASGVTADTSALQGLIDDERRKDAALFADRLEAITGQVRDLEQALEADDLDTVGAIMTANHRILIDMGLSHDTLIRLCDLAREAGAPGAKLTGGGMGGYAFALTPGKELQERVATAIEKEGFQVIRATYGA